jgi:tetratricopeptide (TPR) repeat protein
VAPATTALDSSRAGVAAYSRGDIAGSIGQFTDAVNADPENSQALNNLGQALVRAGRARDAIPYFNRAIAVSGDVWTYHFNRARAYAELQEWGPAISGYREATRLFPDDYATAFNMARALEASGDLAGAIEQYQRAIVLAPGEPDFHLSLAYVLETAQKPQDAMAAYRRYLELQDSGPAAEKVRKRLQELESK